MSLARSTQVFRHWIERSLPATHLHRFRVAFALTWLCYDINDWYLRGTWWTMRPVAALVGGVPPTGSILGLHLSLPSVQLLLSFSEAGLLLGWLPCGFALLACLARSYQILAFGPLNDFVYHALTSALLAIALFDAAPLLRPRLVQKWTLDVMRMQLAFTYLATAFLKLNPSWLSGDHLFVRMEYQAHAPLPFMSGTLTACVERGWCAAGLAWSGVAAEFLLGSLIAIGKTPKLALACAIVLHGFAALTVSVWFFGASMVFHVAFLGSCPSRVGSLPVTHKGS